MYTYWDTNNFDDVGFIEAVIDMISNEYSIDLDRVYACGMSNGGYMSYRLACDLSDKIVAFGSVTGNFMLNPNSVNDCSQQNREIPIVHFHGTYDNIVSYYPPSFDGSLTVSESINYWVEYNDLEYETIEALNNYVNIYTYSKELSNTKFVHYKVAGGGHEWFGINWGFNTSEELINFFINYKLSDFIEIEIQGDFNNDEFINILDVIILVNHILSPETVELDGSDINNDGSVDVLDIIQLVNLILNN